MRNTNQTPSTTRQQVGQWGSFIGSAALLIGVLGFLWQGALSPIVLGSVLIGVFGILLWALISPQEFMGFITGRQVRFGTMTVFSTLLLVGIIALMYILLQRATITLDMTQSRSFSLSSESLEILSKVSRPIRITGFYNSTAIRQREVDDQIFRLYEAATDAAISRNYINPDDEPALAQRYGAYTNGALFLSYLKDDPESESGVSVDFETVVRVPRIEGGAQEREMTQAIARLLLSGTFKVYFEVGLGGLDPLDTSQQGISGVHLGMQESGMLTDAFDLSQLALANRPIPNDAAAVILARPIMDLTPAQLSVIDDYLNRGGSLFIMADALFNENSFLREGGAFNTYLWENYGIRTHDAILVDEGANLRTPLDIIGAAAYTNTDIGARLDPAQSPTLFRIARMVEVNSDNPPVNNGRILSTSTASYGEVNVAPLLEANSYTFDEGSDIPGPLDIAVWAWDQETNARILLVGDGDFISNGFVGSALGNAILFTDGIAWLTGMNESIDFSPSAISTGLPLIFVTTQQLDLIAFVTIILMPGLLLVFGASLWVRRSRQ